MTRSGWEDLRARREQMGLSLEEVSIATRIGVAYLVALEEGRLDDLPEGPYRTAYLRAYREVLELEEVQLEPGSDEQPAKAPPQWAIRIAAAAAVLVLVGVAAWQLTALTSDGPDRVEVSQAPEGSTQPLDPELDQRVSIKALERARLRVEVDGELSWEGRLDAGESLSFAGRDRVAVDLPAAEVARVRWNDQTITPQGRQDVPRRLVFIDDLDGGEP